MVLPKELPLVLLLVLKSELALESELALLRR